MDTHTNSDSSISQSFSTLPVLDLSLAENVVERPKLLEKLREALFNVGFLYVVNHGVPQKTIDNLTTLLPLLFDLLPDEKDAMSKINTPHFLGYSGFAEEITLGKRDLREQFDMATDLPVVWQRESSEQQNESRRDFSKLYWILRGPNQWPPHHLVPGFKKAFEAYHDSVAELSYRFVHLVEEAFGIKAGTFDGFFKVKSTDSEFESNTGFLPPQHRLKLIKYPPNLDNVDGQGVGAHKDSSGWLTFLYQLGQENALEVVNADGNWIPAPPVAGSFVVNFGNAFEAATEGAVRATIHRVKETKATSPTRYSIAFFQGLPLDLKVSEVQSYIPESVRGMRQIHTAKSEQASRVSSFLDPRWDNLGESQLRKWIRSHPDVGRRWFGDNTVEYYLKE